MFEMQDSVHVYIIHRRDKLITEGTCVVFMYRKQHIAKTINHIYLHFSFHSLSKVCPNSETVPLILVAARARSRSEISGRSTDCFRNWIKLS